MDRLLAFIGGTSFFAFFAVAERGEVATSIFLIAFTLVCVAASSWHYRESAKRRKKLEETNGVYEKAITQISEWAQEIYWSAPTPAIDKTAAKIINLAREATSPEPKGEGP